MIIAQRWYPFNLWAVNLSMAQLYQSNLRKTAEDVLRKCNLPATCLELEVAETMLMQHSKQTI